MKLRAGAVHVWRVDLDAVPSDVELLLDARERERLSRIVREPARRRRIAARGVLRALLGDCLQIDPTSLRFATQPAGKPVLALPGTEHLHFNLSHSGALAVYALTELCPVGVDVELLSRRPNAPKRGREELQAWVRYEAEVKLTGVGISGSALRPKRADGQVIDLDAFREPTDRVLELDVGPDAVAALATAERAEVVLESGVVLERQLRGDLAQARGGSVAL